MSDSDRDRNLSRARAVALSYGDAGAPQVVARGYGETAERIIALAREHGIYVHDAPELVSLLMQLDLDERVPAVLYEVIAELLLWLDEMADSEKKISAGQTTSSGCQ